MKRFALAAAATLAFAVPASAYTGVSPTMLTAVEQILVESGMTEIDITTLTDEQVVEIYAAGQAGDANDQINMIKAAVDGEGYGADLTTRRVVLTERDARGLMPAGESSVTASVQNWLETQGFEVDASTLPDDKVAELYFLAFSDEAASEPGRDEIETIINR
ncbi:MAG: hypothetical protein WBA25_06365 [Jannaschia sp.]